MAHIFNFTYRIDFAFGSSAKSWLAFDGNMQGDHSVLGAFTGLVPYVIPVVFYFLGTFVCFIQSLVFTLLSMVYVSMATAHDIKKLN